MANDFLDEIAESQNSSTQEFSVTFRGYDKAEVDAVLERYRAQAQALTGEVEQARIAVAQGAEAARQESLARIQRLESDLESARILASEAEQRATTMAADLIEASEKGSEESRLKFDAILRVAEDQADVLIDNATHQAERILANAHDEATAHRAATETELERKISEVNLEADQVKLRIETELTAHEATLQREAAHAAEKVLQAEREAAAIRTEVEKGSASIRAMVSRETSQMRAEAEREVREMNARVLDFEESLTRRQDDAQQEFLLLHNQAVAHAERITSDANEQVSSALEHAQRISTKADDYEKAMRAQAQSIEADAQLHAREALDRSRVKAQQIVDTVLAHSTSVLRESEDQTRRLRWQQQQLSSFMAEVKELIRPTGAPGIDVAGGVGAVDQPGTPDEPEASGEADAVSVAGPADDASSDTATVTLP